MIQRRMLGQLGSRECGEIRPLLLLLRGKTVGGRGVSRWAECWKEMERGGPRLLGNVERG